MKTNFPWQGYFQPAVERDVNAPLLPHTPLLVCSSLDRSSDFSSNMHQQHGAASFQLPTQRGNARRQRIPLVLTIRPSAETPPNGKGGAIAHH